MLHHVPASLQADANLVRIGVGIDTSRYGHYAAFLRQDLQPAVGELNFLHALQAQLANAILTISCGDPKRNKDHRAALFGAKKSNPVEARAAALCAQ
jgi:hypothetical protein